MDIKIAAIEFNNHNEIPEDVKSFIKDCHEPLIKLLNDNGYQIQSLHGNDNKYIIIKSTE